MATSKGNELVVRLLRQEKDRLSAELTEALKKWMAEFSEVSSTRYKQLQSDFDDVRNQLRLFGDTEGVDRNASPAAQSIEPPQESRDSEDDHIASEATKFSSMKYLTPASQPAVDVQTMRPGRPVVARCAKCQQPTAHRPSKVEQLCSRCNASAERKTMLAPANPMCNSNQRYSLTLTEQKNVSSRREFTSPRSDDDNIVVTLQQTSRHQSHSEQAQIPFELPMTNENVSVTTKKGVFHRNMPIALPDSVYSHIINLEGKLVELVCYKCGATSTSNGTYFHGAHGYHMHVVHHSTEAQLSIETVIERAASNNCVRPVSAEDIARIENGDEPLQVKGLFLGKKQESSKKAVLNEEAQPSSNITIPSDATNHIFSGMPQEFDQLDRTRYSTIVFIKGGWHDIWCHICDANVGSDKKRRNYGQFFRGMQGLHVHMTVSHDIDPERFGLTAMKFKEVIRFCGKRPLSDEDVQRIRAGKEPRTAIVKRFAKMFKGPTGKSLGAESRSSLDTLQSPVTTGTNRTGSSNPTPQNRSSLSAHVHPPSSTETTSSPMPYRSKPEGQRTSVGSQHNKRVRSPSPGVPLNDSRRTSGGATGSQPLWNQFQDIQADGKNLVDYHGTRGKRRKRVIEEDDEDYTDDSDDMPLAGRAKKR